MRRGRSEEFGRRVREVLDANPVGGKPISLREADRRTGVNYATLSGMSMGDIPAMESVVRFAQGFGLDANEWLELAGYPPIEDQDAKRIARRLLELAAERGDDPGDYIGAAFGEMSPEQRQRTLDVLRRWSDEVTAAEEEAPEPPR